MTRRTNTDAFRAEAVKLALTSGLSRSQVAEDLGIGQSTFRKWITAHKHADLMSGPHDDVQKELRRLRKENRILREERDLLKKKRSSSRAKNDERPVHQGGEGQ